MCNIDENIIKKMAFEYWNFDILPPREYRHAVAHYIAYHSEEFKGAGPQ